MFALLCSIVFNCLPT